MTTKSTTRTAMEDTQLNCAAISAGRRVSVEPVQGVGHSAALTQRPKRSLYTNVVATLKAQTLGNTAPDITGPVFVNNSVESEFSVEPSWEDFSDFGVCTHANSPTRLPPVEERFGPGENEPWPDLSSLPNNIDPLDLARLPAVESGEVSFMSMYSEQWAGVCSDYANFYSPRSLARLGGGLVVAGVMANTAFDDNFIRHSYRESVVFAASDELYELLHQPKFLGEGYYTIPVFAAAALLEPLIDDVTFGPEISEWGQRSLRTILVGGPPMIGLQFLTGASRPGEANTESRWRPFRDNNGVSGHSFMGAVPFMSAAAMTDNPWLKGSLYVASAMPAISRVNDDGHYFSQAFLGWWIAYVASNAVNHSHNATSNHRYFFYPEGDGLGLGVEIIR